MNIITLPLGPLGTNCYLVSDGQSGLCAVIDPGAAAPKILQRVQDEGWRIGVILLTHAHFDHTGALKALHSALPSVPIYAEAKSVSLERTKRLAQMREEREMRKAEEAADFSEEDEFADTTSGKKNGGKKDDIVLSEAFNILADLARLTGGNEAPDTPDASSAFWSIFGGAQ